MEIIKCSHCGEIFQQADKGKLIFPGKKDPPQITENRLFGFGRTYVFSCNHCEKILSITKI
jgi:hypothetical protein